MAQMEAEKLMKNIKKISSAIGVPVVFFLCGGLLSVTVPAVAQSSPLFSQVPIDGDTVQLFLVLGGVLASAVWAISNLRKDIYTEIGNLSDRLDARFDRQNEVVSEIKTTIALLKQEINTLEVNMSKIADGVTITKGRVAAVESLTRQLEGYITALGGNFVRRTGGRSFDTEY